jgi:hypothetical protein
MSGYWSSHLTTSRSISWPRIWDSNAFFAKIRCGRPVPATATRRPAGPLGTRFDQWRRGRRDPAHDRRSRRQAAPKPHWLTFNGKVTSRPFPDGSRVSPTQAPRD